MMFWVSSRNMLERFEVLDWASDCVSERVSGSSILELASRAFALLLYYYEMETK